jgi:hypothetical protein
MQIVVIYYIVFCVSKLQFFQYANSCNFLIVMNLFPSPWIGEHMYDYSISIFTNFLFFTTVTCTFVVFCFSTYTALHFLRWIWFRMLPNLGIFRMSNCCYFTYRWRYLCVWFKAKFVIFSKEKIYLL